MKQITAFQTADGCLFETDRQAKRHAQKRYDDAMTAIRLAVNKAHDDIHPREILTIMSWIESNWVYVKAGFELLADTKVEPEEDS